MNTAMTPVSILTAANNAGAAARPATDGGFVMLLSDGQTDLGQVDGQQTPVGRVDPRQQLASLLSRLKGKASALLDSMPGAAQGLNAEPGGEAVQAQDMAAGEDPTQVLGATQGPDEAQATDQAQGPDQVQDGAQAAEAVAGLASVLAAALARFEQDTGAGLLNVLNAQLPAPSSGGETATAPQGGAAASAVQALMSVIDRVERGLQSLPASPQATAMATEQVQGFVRFRDMSRYAAMQVGTAANDAQSDAAPGPDGASALRQITVPAGEPAPAPTLGLSATPDVGPDAGSNAGPAAGDLASRALLKQIVDAASVSVQSDPRRPAEPGALPPPIDAVRRAAEPLLSVDDVTRALSAHEASVHHASHSARAESAEQAAQPPRFAAALTAQIRAADISEGRTRIALNPRGLGNIEVEVQTDQDGALKVVVRAENPTVLNSLRQERDLLAQAIGGAADGGTLDFQTFSHGSDRNTQDQTSRPAAAMPEYDAAAPAETPRQSATIGGGRLDIMT